MKGNPAVPGGSLTSKPTRWNAFGRSARRFLFSRAPGGPEGLPMEIGHGIPAIVLEFAALIEGYMKKRIIMDTESPHCGKGPLRRSGRLLPHSGPNSRRFSGSVRNAAGAFSKSAAKQRVHQWSDLLRFTRRPTTSPTQEAQRSNSCRVWEALGRRVSALWFVGVKPAKEVSQ